VRCASERRSAGEAICARASEESADLLVLGAYGHSRFAKSLFGGVTRYIARHLPVPTLFSH
jgi:nucleotide-binding universal stress UspA family protein